MRRAGTLCSTLVKRCLPFIGVVLLAAVLSACGGDTLAANPAAALDDAPANGDVRWPACTPPIVQSVSLPAAFAPNFPLPWGMRLYRVTTTGADAQHPQLEVVGLAPMNLSDAENYLRRQLPRTGYHVGFGEAESGEAEGQFQGQGWIGSYRVNAVPACAAVTTWTIVVVKR